MPFVKLMDSCAVYSCSLNMQNCSPQFPLYMMFISIAEMFFDALISIIVHKGAWMKYETTVLFH